MPIERYPIISNQETVNESIDAEQLKKLSLYPEAGALTHILRDGEQVTSIHILGGSTEPALDGQFCSYRYNSGHEILLLNPPDGYLFDELPWEKISELDMRFTTVANLDLPRMPQLLALNLANNSALKNVTGWENLPSLIQLDVHNTQLKELDALGVCNSLKTLNVSGLELEDPRFLSKLTALKTLDLSWSNIVRFPDLTKLSRLWALNLSGTALPNMIETKIPDSLEDISLANSSICRIPDGFRTLRHLKRLDLSGLHLNYLPDWLADLDLEFVKRKDSLRGIVLGGTVVEGIDMSIFDQPQEVIRKWFQERREDDRLVPMNEVKVVFLGDGGAGKSHIITRLLNDGVPREDFLGDVTPGISISNMRYILDNKDVTVHFWDFGGQEILHSMHRMFLTERTVYVLVVNARDGSCQERSLYWLRTLKSFTENCPVLLVLNNIDQNPRAAVDQWALRELCPELTDIVRLSARYDSTETFRANFTDVLLRLIGEQPFLDTMLPASWQQLRRRLSSLNRDYIFKAEFEELCDECGISAASDVRESLLSWFHDLGICFHRTDNRIRAPYIVLQPAWISHALTSILYSLYDRASNGLVPLDSVLNCLHTSDRSDFNYTRQDAEYILDLMHGYRFSVRMPDDQEFIPALCDRDAPVIFDEYRRNPGAFRFRLTYAYLPLELLHQLMAELKKHLDVNNVWLSGAQFIWTDTQALVTCEEDVLNIYIEAGSSQSRAEKCLSTIRDALERIHNDNHIQAGQLQVGYRQGDSLEWFSYDALTAMVRSGSNRVYSSALQAMIPISEIWTYTDQQAEMGRFVERISRICEAVQSNSVLWGANAEHLTHYLRDSFSLQGYRVLDQTMFGQTGKQSPILEIRSASDDPWAVGGTLYVRGGDKPRRIAWDMQFEKMVKACVQTPAPVVFTVTFAACRTEEYSGMCKKYAQTFESFSPDEGSILPIETEVLVTVPMIYAIRCVYNRAVAPVTAYHFFVRIGYDQVIAEKMEQRRQMPNNEYKVVFLGDGEAGKSLTVGRLHEPDRDPKSFDGEVTPGVDIRSRPYEVKGVDVQVNFWDFGGQEILHSMHRIFLSRRALYVVLLNARNDSQDDRARFWLRYIATYAPGAPVFLVLNKIDQNEHAEFNKPVLRRQYPNIKQFLRISALKFSKDEFEENFIVPLEDHIDSIHVEESAFLKTEQPVRDILRSWKDPRISLQEYEKICCDHGIEDAIQQEALLKKLEDSGICVRFDGHSSAGQYRLLEPKWITKAMYSILFYLHSQAKNGIISHEKLHHFLEKELTELRHAVYQPDEVEFILQVMRFYRLSFEIQDQKKEFLPMLCPKEEASELDAFLKEKDHLEFHMCFDYLPAEVLYQLMVARQHELELDQDSIWLTGALLRDGNGCRAAMVKENNVLKFYISRSKGLPHARSYMDSLRHDMEQIIRKNSLHNPETRVVYKYTYRYNGKEHYIQEPFDLDRLILSQECGVLNTVSKELDIASEGQTKIVAVSDILEQTYHSETILHEKLFHQLVQACHILQENFDNWVKLEPVLNRYLRDLLRAMGYRITDQPESGASAAWESPGRPDLIVNFEDSASSVLIEPLRINGCTKKDINNWDKHLEKMVNNYNSSGYRMMFLISYATCTKTHFKRIDKFYYERMRKAPPNGGVGKPEHCRRSKEKWIPDLIRITRAEYYTQGYSPTIYHILVHIPKTKLPPDTKSSAD